MRGFRMAWWLSLWLVACSVQALPWTIEVVDGLDRQQTLAEVQLQLLPARQQVAGGLTDGSGRFSLNTEMADDSSTTLTLKKHGLVVIEAPCPCNGKTYAMLPVKQNFDGLRIVLTWEADGLDLDARLIYPGKNLYFETLKGPDTLLEGADKPGRGPEVITLEKKHAGDSYIYAVYDFTHGTTARAHQLSLSQAKVQLYLGKTLLRTYKVPRQRVGNLWTVFRITGNSELQDINRLGEVRGEPADAMSEVEVLLDDKVAVSSLEVGAVPQGDAKTLNEQGEATYKAGDVLRSRDFFRQAIEQDPTYAQAYSNLGLTHRKLGELSRALEADNQAIALASGATAATVRASAYYNSASIYEAAGRFADALALYQKAREQKASPVYDQAIERVRKL